MKLSNKTYETGKWLSQIFLPAVGVFYFALSDLWNLPKPLETIGSLSALAAFIGVVLGVSTANYKKDHDVPVGEVTQNGIDPDTGMPGLSIKLNRLPHDVLEKKTITLRVDRSNNVGLDIPNVEVQPDEL